ncbi:MAG: RnfABCDGE type electron transport complex subunit G [Deltaproteobacteria bacterium]|nr:RnfABCDGE type electron transport complex subunit G [Deltaproteobacteria bacterium]
MSDAVPAPRSEGLRDLLVPVLVIVIISAGSALLLGLVREATREAIAAADRAEAENALKIVLPAGLSVDVTKPFTATVNGRELEFFAGTDEAGTLRAVAAKTASDKGYSGLIRILVGFTGLDDSGTLQVTRTYVLSHAETPGLGSKITTCQEQTDAAACGDAFWTRFQGRAVSPGVLKPVKDGGEIQALTSATISTRAVCDAVLEAGEYVKAHRQEILDGLRGAPGKGGTP